MSCQSSDEELVSRCRAGEEDAFAHLYARYRHSVFSTAYRIIQNLEESQDATQEIFVKVYRSLSDWDPERAKFSTWLYRLASNHSIDCWRVRRRRDSQLSDQPPGKKYLEHCLSEGVRSPYRVLEGKEQAKEIKRCVNSLPELQKKIFVLRYFQGMKLEEIASMEDRSLGTIKASLFRATHSVRKRMRAYQTIRPSAPKFAGTWA